MSEFSYWWEKPKQGLNETIFGIVRFLDQNQASAWIGFRCAMDRVGSPVGLGGK